MNTNTLPQVPAQIAMDTVSGITDKQVAFIKKLIAQVETKVGTSDMTRAKFALEFNAKILARLERGDLNKRDGSRLIETLIRHANDSYEVAVVQEKAPVGVYKHDGEIYRVIKARQSEKTYAQKLIAIEGRAPRWEIAYGFVLKLKVEELIAPEVAAQMGRSVGYCVICGRFLTDAESVAKGIGPVCFERVSVNYGKYSPIYAG